MENDAVTHSVPESRHQKENSLGEDGRHLPCVCVGVLVCKLFWKILLLTATFNACLTMEARLEVFFYIILFLPCAVVFGFRCGGGCGCVACQLARRGVMPLLAMRILYRILR